MSLQSLTRFFKTSLSPNDPKQSSEDRDQALRTATAAILLDIAYADDSFSVAEESKLLDFLKERFALSDDLASELLETAEEMRSNSIDHWNVTNVIRKSLSLEERIEIVKVMWGLVYADDHIHQYENYLVRKMADLLGLEHHVMIEAKLAVREQKS